MIREGVNFVGKKNQCNMLSCTVRNTKLKEGF